MSDNEAEDPIEIDKEDAKFILATLQEMTDEIANRKGCPPEVLVPAISMCLLDNVAGMTNVVIEGKGRGSENRFYGLQDDLFMAYRERMLMWKRENENDS